MRVFIAVLVLIFSFQSLTKADYISDFEIEGISLGDSLLDHFNEKQIEKEINSEYTFRYKKNKFLKIGVGYGEGFHLEKKIDNYDDIGITLKTNDKKYLIYGLHGRIFCDEGIDECFSKQKDIVFDLKNFLGNKVKIDVWEDYYRSDKTNKSKVYGTDLIFENSGEIMSVTVYDYSNKFTEETKFYDHTSLTIFSNELYDFIQNEAYK